MTSVYIPYLFNNITKDYISKTFEFQKLGKVKNIDFVEKMDKNGKIYNSAFVHFEYWYDNIASIHFQQRLKDPNKEARIVYKDPWFWVCFKNTGKKMIPGQRKERINVSAFSEVSNDGFGGSEEIKTEDKLERELLEEFNCEEHDFNCDLIIKKPQVNMEYVRNLEMLNYKLIHDLYELRGDFIMT